MIALIDYGAGNIQSVIKALEYIGCDEYFFGEGVCLIEWAELIEEMIPENAVWIKIEKNLEKGIDYRKITFGGEE